MIKNYVDIDTKLDKVNDECGVFGIYRNDDDIDVVAAANDALFSLQHRGQQSAGITVNKDGEFTTVKELGMVSEIFTPKALEKLPNGKIAVGHVRYTSSESLDRASNQPLVMRYIQGSIGIANNGSITNFNEIRQELETGGAVFQSNSNAEIMAYVIATERCVTDTLEDAVLSSMRKLKGAYSTVICAPSRLIGFRDMHGFRPLCIGKLKNSWIFTSESCVIDSLGGEFVRDVEPGEIVIVDQNGVRSMKPDFGDKKKALCIFEYIYFARSDSFIDGVSVYEARKQAGRILARKYPVEADMVVGVPESGIDAAIGYSEESGIPYEKAIVKNSYIGRTFIKPSQKERMKSVKIKLNPIADKIKGKRVVIIDDSIVRGTTVDRIVTMLKEAGAKEVHMRISSPPFMWPCYYGTDIPSRGELIACNHTIEEITKLSKADSLGYLPVESLREMIHNAPVGFCDGCFTGNYPAPITKETFKGKERGGMNFDENNKKDN